MLSSLVFPCLERGGFGRVYDDKGFLEITIMIIMIIIMTIILITCS